MKWADQHSDAAQALTEAQRLQEEAAAQGFDWPELAPLWDKLAEEITELRAAVDGGDRQEMLGELGDLFFMLVNFCRFLQISPTEALQSTNEKFIHRLRHVEQRLTAKSQAWAETDIEELEVLWQEAKGAR